MIFVFLSSYWKMLTIMFSNFVSQHVTFSYLRMNNVLTDEKSILCFNSSKNLRTCTLFPKNVRPDRFASVEELKLLFSFSPISLSLISTRRNISLTAIFSSHVIGLQKSDVAQT